MTEQPSSPSPEQPPAQPAAQSAPFEPQTSTATAAPAAPAGGELNFAVDKDTVPGLAAAALVLLGSLGTWAKAGPFSVSGLDGDGVITLIAALVAAAAIFFGRRLKLAAAAALVIVAVALYDTIDVLGSGNDIIDVGLGWGLILTLLAGLGLLAWIVLNLRKPSAP